MFFPKRYFTRKKENGKKIRGSGDQELSHIPVFTSFLR